MAPGWLAFEHSLCLVSGLATSGTSVQILRLAHLYDCHPHPHNYFIQMLGEAGIVGLVTGT